MDLSKLTMMKIHYDESREHGGDCDVDEYAMVIMLLARTNDGFDCFGRQDL